jgi:hypothetical protein
MIKDNIVNLEHRFRPRSGARFCHLGGAVQFCGVRHARSCVQCLKCQSLTGHFWATVNLSFVEIGD